MDNHFRMRKAIIIAIALMGTGYSMHSRAIGLGDVQMKSFLGQPLLAKIRVHGIDNKTDESCFHVNSDDANAIQHVHFKLSHLGNDEGLLTLTSRHPILEPVALLTVVNQCDAPFTRQYTLLIDPATTTQQFTADSDDIADAASNPTNVQSASMLAPTTQTKAQKKKSRINTNKQTSSEADLPASAKPAQVVYAKTPLTPAKSERSNPSAEARLSISGGHLATLTTDAAHLVLDKRINTSREANPLAYSPEAEFSDEVTVMNHRLAHLEKQLTGLYAKNKTLETSNMQSKAQIEEMKHQNDFLRMLSFFLGGGLLASSYFFIDWFKRRKAVAHIEKEMALWDYAEQEPTEEMEESQQPFTIDDDYVPAPHMHESIEVKTADDMSEFEQSHIFNSPFNTTTVDEVEDESGNVMEDADVFVSHGRTSLAIQLLQNHLMDYPKESASTWLFLLDLLAKEGKQKEFEIAARECKNHFNVQLADFSKPLADSNTIESFERITAQLQTIWGTPEAVRFLDELIYNTRLEPRMGFDKAVFEELVLLREIAQEEIKLAEIIDLNTEKNARKEKKETLMTLNLPEIEISDEFKALGQDLELENAQKNKHTEEVDQFEFELIDIAYR